MSRYGTLVYLVWIGVSLILRVGHIVCYSAMLFYALLMSLALWYDWHRPRRRHIHPEMIEGDRIEQLMVARAANAGCCVVGSVDENGTFTMQEIPVVLEIENGELKVVEKK